MQSDSALSTLKISAPQYIYCKAWPSERAAIPDLLRLGREKLAVAMSPNEIKHIRQHFTANGALWQRWRFLA
jgi:hypothetical protein